MISFGQRQHQVFAWIILVLIIILSLIPGSTIPKLKWQELFGIDKIVHFLLYGSCLYFFVAGYDIKRNTATFYYVFTGLCLLGLFMEILQMISHSGRSFDIMDLLANFMGLIAVACLNPSKT